MKIPGLVLTGGASTRMGRPKADVRWDGERLADRVARVVTSVCEPVLEVGPGFTTLPSVVEDPPGRGPLAALVAGVDALAADGALPPVLLVAVDMPFVTGALLTFLCDRPGHGTVVPVTAGHAQPLCARYDADACERAALLVAAGERSMHALLASVAVELVPEHDWHAVAPQHALTDVDTPADLARWNEHHDG
ncbi:MAG TPA: molybdenum cofactor guanylyltransferase [Acidimicrobiia bacterium]|nr:molybdenum cofactor guanylyltransferase [Acidimicrobiia bacterium]